MSPLQRSDDAGRQIRQPWLGAVGARWPMDWEYREWGVAFAAFAVGGTLITWVIPAALVTGVMIHSAARFISSQAAPDAPKRTYRIVVGCMVAACALFSVDPWTWITPLPWFIALAISPALPFIAVKRWGPLVNWNRPIAYWWRLVGQVASGPRALPQRSIDPSRLALDLETLGHDTGDLVLARIVVIPKVRVRKPKPVATPKPVAKATPVATPKPVAKATPERTVVAAKITSAPKKRIATVPVRERRLVQPGAAPRARRQNLIYRTPTGLMVFGTEYRLEG
jgi:hypothetical protein